MTPFQRIKLPHLVFAVCLSLLLLVFGMPRAIASKNADCLKVTLTGTGSPDVDGDRAKAGALVRYGTRSNQCSDVILQFDAGSGTLNRFEQLNLDVNSIDAFFITHSHHDHTAGLPSILQETWVDGLISDLLSGSFPPVIEPPVIYVPAEADNTTADIVTLAAEVFDEERQGRVDSVGLPPTPPFDTLADHNPDIRALAAGATETVMNDGASSSVTVTTFENGHMATSGPGVASFSYRIETPAGTVVITGDTPSNPGLVDFAQGADIVVSEIGLAPPELVGIPLIDNVFAAHIPPDDVAQIASSAGPNSTVLLTHFIISPPSTNFLGLPFSRITSCSYVNAIVAGGFNHRIIAGNDLDTITLTNSRRPELCQGNSEKCRRLLDNAGQRRQLCRRADRV